MDDRQHAACQAYLRDLAKALLLADWEITLDRDRSIEGSYAHVHVMETENHAVICVQWPEFFHAKPEEQREWLTHELLHAHLDRPQRVLRTLLDECQHNDALALASTLHMNEIEICVQRMARLLAPNLPLPDFNKEPEPGACAFCGHDLAMIAGVGLACHTRGCPLEVRQPQPAPQRCPECGHADGVNCPVVACPMKPALDVCPTCGETAIEGGCLYLACPMRG